MEKLRPRAWKQASCAFIDSFCRAGCFLHSDCSGGEGWAAVPKQGPHWVFMMGCQGSGNQDSVLSSCWGQSCEDRASEPQTRGYIVLVRLLQNGAPAQPWGGPVLLCVLVTPSSSEPVPASILAPLLWSWHPVGTGWPYQVEWVTGKTGALEPPIPGLRGIC